MRALAFAVAQALNSEGPPTLSLVGKGSFNLIFRARLPRGDTVIARLPIAAQHDFDTGSVETSVAAMTFARRVLHLPCPEVYAWNSERLGPVNAPYIIMSDIKGDNLAFAWDRLHHDEQMAVIGKVAKLHSKMRRPLPFDGYGFLKFSSRMRAKASASAADFSDPRSYETGNTTWPPASLLLAGNGVELPPSSNIRSTWLSAWKSEIARMFQIWIVMRNASDSDRLSLSATFFDGTEPTSDELCYYADCVRQVFENCVLPENDMEFCLLHSDFAFRNIMYDRSSKEITGILDWDRTMISPSFCTAMLPEDVCFHAGSTTWDRKGAFWFLPVDEYPEEVDEANEYKGRDQAAAAFAAHANRGGPFIVYERDEAIEASQFRNRYLEDLVASASRFEETSWRKRESALVAYHLATHGFTSWIEARNWFLLKPSDFPDSRYPRPQMTDGVEFESPEDFLLRTLGADIPAPCSLQLLRSIPLSRNGALGLPPGITPSSTSSLELSKAQSALHKLIASDLHIPRASTNHLKHVRVLVAGSIRTAVSVARSALPAWLGSHTSFACHSP